MLCVFQCKRELTRNRKLEYFRCMCGLPRRSFPTDDPENPRHISVYNYKQTVQRIHFIQQKVKILGRNIRKVQFLIENPSKPTKTHQNPSKPMRTHRKPSKSIKTHGNTLEPIKTHENPPKPINVKNMHDWSWIYTQFSLFCIELL